MAQKGLFDPPEGSGNTFEKFRFLTVLRAHLAWLSVGGWWLSVGAWWRLAIVGWQLAVVGLHTGVPPLHAIRGLPGPVLGDFGPLKGFRVLPAATAAAAARFGDSEHSNGCRQAPAGSLGPKLLVQYGLTQGNLLPLHRIPLCGRTQDTES